MTDRTADTDDIEYRPTVSKGYIVLAWLWVAIPFGYGLVELLDRVRQLFA